MARSTLSLKTPPTQVPDGAEEAILHRVKLLGAMVARQLQADWTDVGRLDDVCRYALGAPGKFFRPILVLESASLVGGELDRVLPAAAGTEGAHVASLIHDDIIDGDETRRGQPATHVAFGRDDAIVGGDALLFYLFGALAECGTRGVTADRIVTAMGKAAEAGTDLCRGQLMEEGIRAAYDCRVQSYLEMIENKTGALFRAACYIGAILGGGSTAQCDALARYGTALGIAFQIQDDLLPYLSTSEDAGKQLSSDLANRRLTLPFLLCRAEADAALTVRLDELMSGDDDVEDRHRQLSLLLLGSGAVERAITMALRYTDDAIDALSGFPAIEARTSFEYFAKAAVKRCR
jgi:geranylgeranyl diphosphate synthase type I